MTKKAFSLIVAATLITMLPGWVSNALAQAVPASAVSCHFVARVYFNFTTTPPTATVAGYITDIPGIGDPNKGQDSLFNITSTYPIPSENNAILTFHADQVLLGPVAVNGVTPSFPNGVVTPFQVDSGHFNIYYTQNPNGRDWNDPNTFSHGHTVPDTPDPTAAVNLERDQSLAFETDTLVKHDVTEHLISSKPFTLQSSGNTYDLGKFFPAGFTLYETYSTQSLGTPPGWPSGMFPGAGNCAAVAATAAEGENPQ